MRSRCGSSSSPWPLQGNDQNLNSVLGNLPQFAADATDILRVLDIQHGAVVRLVQNGGTVFSALTQDQSALRNLVTSAATTFHATASVNNALADTFHVFPTFLNETKATMTRLKAFALDTDPLTKQLLPVAADLGPTLFAVKRLSPDLRRLFVNLGPLITVSKTGLPGIRDVLLGAKPLFASLAPFLGELNPILHWLSLHQQLISDFISNGAAGLAAKTVSIGGGGTGHYLRQFSPVGPETLSFSPVRDAGNRGNTYPPPLWLADPNVLKQNILPSWDCKNTCAGGAVGPADPSACRWSVTRRAGSPRRSRAQRRRRFRTSRPRSTRASRRSRLACLVAGRARVRAVRVRAAARSGGDDAGGGARRAMRRCALADRRRARRACARRALDRRSASARCGRAGARTLRTQAAWSPLTRASGSPASRSSIVTVRSEAVTE